MLSAENAATDDRRREAAPIVCCSILCESLSRLRAVVRALAFVRSFLAEATNKSEQKSCDLQLESLRFLEFHNWDRCALKLRS